MKPDYNLKSQILTEYKKLDLYNKCKKVVYKSFYVGNVSKQELDNSLTTLAMLENANPAEFKEYRRISDAKCARVRRIKKRMFDMIYKNDCLFLTLTFNNEAFKYNTADSRRQAVRRFLNSFNVPYVANIDFGKKNGREHYHAVIQIGEIDYHLWTYGAIKGLRVRNDLKYDEDGVFTSESVEKISRYVAKLTNHAIKETTRRSVIMYSRGKYGSRQIKENNLAFLSSDEPLYELNVQQVIKI